MTFISAFHFSPQSFVRKLCVNMNIKWKDKKLLQFFCPPIHRFIQHWPSLYGFDSIFFSFHTFVREFVSNKSDKIRKSIFNIYETSIFTNHTVVVHTSDQPNNKNNHFFLSHWWNAVERIINYDFVCKSNWYRLTHILHMYDLVVCMCVRRWLFLYFMKLHNIHFDCLKLSGIVRETDVLRWKSFVFEIKMFEQRINNEHTRKLIRKTERLVFNRNESIIILANGSVHKHTCDFSDCSCINSEHFHWPLYFSESLIEFLMFFIDCGALICDVCQFKWCQRITNK